MFSRMQADSHEALHFRLDRCSGLRAVIAIHNTRLGPALGGCRCIEYGSEDAAIADVLRLSRGMSYKAALAGVPYGGGKAVIMKPAESCDRVALFEAFGEFVESLGGRYITAVDSGSTVADMAVVARRTAHATSCSRQGDPSPWTALGVYEGMLAAVRVRLGCASLSGLHVAIQGVGNVGRPLAARLRAAGARLTLADINRPLLDAVARELGAATVPAAAIHSQDCDVFAPCGLGGVINERTLPELRCAVLAGSANNQLENEALAADLHARGILYAPDYVINAGGLIAVALAHSGQGPAAIEAKTRAIGATLEALFRRAETALQPAAGLARAMAEEIIGRGPVGGTEWSDVRSAIGL